METYNLFIVFLIAITYVHVTFGAPIENNTGFGQFTLCATDECVNAASEILAKLNRTVDPCDDFYKFACGGWLQNNRANQSFPRIDFITVLAGKTEHQLREILEGPDKENDTVSLRKAKHVYEQCMNTGDSKVIGKNNLSAIVNAFGGWPMIMPRHDWDKKNLTWQNVSAILQENDFDNGLYNIEVLIDDKMSNSNVIVIADPSFMYSRNYMIQLNSSQKESYVSHIVGVAKNLTYEIDGTVEDDNLTRDALDIVNLEIELANLTSTYEEYSNLNTFYIPLTIQQLQEEYDKQHPGINGKIDWHTTIQKVFASEGITIEPSEKLVVQAYKYFTRWTPLFERSSRTIVNYILWTVIRNLFKYKKQPQKTDVQPGRDDTRWKGCVREINLKSAISYEYVKKYTSNLNMQAIKEIATDVESAISEQIRRSTWMDEPTREASLEKIAYMRHDFFQPEWYSDEAIDKYYENLNVSVEYLDNIINILKFEKKKMMGSLRKPVDRKRWFMEPTIPQAYNNPFTNTIVFTAALLQDPIYNKSRLPLLNYGTLGAAIAHEMTHGFDNTIHMYNKDGSYVPQWWTQKSIDEYEKILQCFIDQYNNYLVPGLEYENVHVNGRFSVGENIADSSGIVTAYYAYKNRKTRLNETEWRMQGLEDYSDDQLFFLIYAQKNCATLVREYIAMQFNRSSHPVKEIKIRGLSNSREFSEIYNCSSGTPMNPEKKCVLWY